MVALISEIGNSPIVLVVPVFNKTNVVGDRLYLVQML